MTLTARKALPADAYLLNLREEDQREVTAGWRTRVAHAIEAGHALAFEDGDHLVGLFGVTDPAQHTVSPWLLCSPEVRRHRAATFRYARRLVGVLRKEARAGKLVFNHIPKDAESNRRFIQRLGFAIVPSPDGTQDLFYLPHV